MKALLHVATSRIRSAAIAALLSASTLAAASAQQQPGSQLSPNAPPIAAPTSAANPDWPCVQHKQATLTAAQMWDGPAIAAEGQRSDDAAVRKLVAVIISRRHEMSDVEAAIKAFADTVPAGQRDAKLTELFQMALGEINVQRNSIVQGIERFQRRQVARAKKLEDEGIALAEQHKAAGYLAAGTEPPPGSALADAQIRYDWDARVFQERQQNIPIACEIPVLIEQRAFALAQAIRAMMAN